MIISDCLPLGWLAIRPISIDGIHPLLFVGKNNIERNDLPMTKVQMARFAPLRTFYENINSNAFSLWCISEYNGPEEVAVSAEPLELGCALPLAGR